MTNYSTIENVSELLTELKKFETRLDFVKEEKLLYRGQGDKSFNLIPAIGRYPNDNIGNPLSWFEENIYEEAKNAFPTEYNDNLKPLDFLAKLQHYGIPTRLLDITESPLVALYFACSDPKLMNEDGELFVFKNLQFRPTYDAISQAIADTCYISERELDGFLKYAMSKSYFDNERKALEDLYKIDPQYGNTWIPECYEDTFYIHRAFMTNRQQLQMGSFILFSNEIIEIEGTNRKRFGDKISPIDKNNEKIIFHRFIIPSNKKREILQELDKIGINRRNLFADSIDIVCEEIKNHYIDRFKMDF